jgi:hypothetical protein
LLFKENEGLKQKISNIESEIEDLTELRKTADDDD